MDQLWYTWSTVGLGSVTGHRVRAASHELMDLHGDWYREIERHLQYELPEDVNPYDIETTSSPYSLAYIKTEKGPILLHRAYTGENVYGCTGVFFAHVLANLNDMSALAAIGLWRSPFWKLRDDLPPDQLELPQVVEIPDGLLNVATMSNQLTGRQIYARNLTFLVESYLDLSDGQNIYIETYAEEGLHAASERNAELIWGLLNCLPPYLTGVATFSTYEADMERSPARINATCFASLDALRDARPHDGPLLKCAYGRDGSSLLLETIVPPQLEADDQGQSDASKVSREQQLLCHSYARYVVTKLLEGQEADLKELDALFSLSGEWNIKDKATFLLTYKLFTSDKLTEEDMGIVLLPERAVALLVPETVRDAVLQFIFAHQQWWLEGGQQAWQRLSQCTAATPGLARTLSDFATYIRDKLVADLIGGKPGWAGMYLELLSTIAPPKHQPRLWRSLLEGLAPYLYEHRQQYPAELFDPSFYALLLENCSYISNLPDETLRPWLRVSWDNVGNLCLQNIASNWKVKAIAWLILWDQQPFPRDIVKIVTAVSQNYEDALQWLVLREEAAPAAVANLIQLVERGYNQQSSAVARLLGTQHLSAEDVDRLLTQTSLDVEQQDELFLQYWEFLLALAPHIQIVQDMTERYFTHFLYASILHQPGTEALLNMVKRRKQYLHFLQASLEYWLLIRSTIPAGPTSDALELVHSETKLRRLGEAISKVRPQRDPLYQDYLFRYLVTGIYSDEDLQRCIKCIGSELFPKSSRIVFMREMAPIVGAWYIPNRDPKFLLPYIQQALQDAQSHPKKNEILPAILQQLLQNADKKTFDAIDRAIVWNEAFEKEWKRYSEALRPRLSFFSRFSPGSSKERGETAKMAAIKASPTNPARLVHVPAAPQGLLLEAEVSRATVQPSIAASPSGQLGLLTKQSAATLTRSNKIAATRQDPQGLPAASGEKLLASSNVQSVESHDIIAWVDKVPIPFERFRKFEAFKMAYINYRRDKMNVNKGDEFNQRWRRKEVERFSYFELKECMIQSAIQALAFDSLIQEELRHLSRADIQSYPQKALEAALADAKKQKDCRRLLSSGSFTEADLQAVLLIFLRAHAFEFYLLANDSNLTLWLDYQQQRHPIHLNKGLIRRYKDELKKQNQ